MRFFCVSLMLASLFLVPGVFAEEALDLAGIAKLAQAAQEMHGKPMPKALVTRGGTLDKGGYDPNQFLALFPKLSIASGQVLDFVYDYQEGGGHPVLYARPAGQEPFSSLAEFKKQYPRRYFIGDKIRFDPAYLGSIIADGTPDSFLQLALMVLTGEQFYIHWHAAYYLFLPIMDQATFDRIIGVYPRDEQKKGREIDFKPRVIVEQTRVRVEYHVFNHWVGLKRISWTVSREFPHRLLALDEKVLLPYKSPVQF